MLLIEVEVAELDLAIERVSVERHWRGRGVLILLRVVRAVNDDLRPDLLIAVRTRLCASRVIVALTNPLVDLDISGEKDSVSRLKF